MEHDGWFNHPSAAIWLPHRGPRSGHVGRRPRSWLLSLHSGARKLHLINCQYRNAVYRVLAVHCCCQQPAESPVECWGMQQMIARDGAGENDYGQVVGRTLGPWSKHLCTSSSLMCWSGVFMVYQIMMADSVRELTLLLSTHPHNQAPSGIVSLNQMRV